MQGEWYSGAGHEELLQAALQRQRKEKSAKTVAQETVDTNSSLPDLINSISEHLESNFNTLFDSFTEFDVEGQGKVSALEFREGIRTLSSRFLRIPDKAIDRVFEHIDLNGSGYITLEQYIRFFSQKFGSGKATVLESGNRVMPLSSGMTLRTARNDIVTSERHDRRLRLKLMLSPERPSGANTSDAYRKSPQIGDIGHVQGMSRRTAKTKHVSEASSSIDFAVRNRWIDEMMDKLGVSQEKVPPWMHDKWDSVLKECRLLDSKSRQIVSAEGFRNVLTRVEPRLSAEQVEWFIKDADKDEFGDVSYEKYLSRKNSDSQRKSIDPAKAQLSVLCTEAKLRAALRINYTTLKQAFKAMDIDRDGRLSREELRTGIERRLRLKIPPRMYETVFARIDTNHDGFIEFEHFQNTFAVAGYEKGSADMISDEELSKRLLAAHGNVAQLFSHVDQDCDGIVSCEDILNAVRDPRIGINISLQRAADFATRIDNDGNGVIDFRDFLRYFSSIVSEDTNLKTVDRKSYELIVTIREKLRERFDDAKQAFHAFDKKFAARLSLQDFLEGMKHFCSTTEEPSEELSDMLEKVFQLADSNGDGFVDYHDFITRFHIKPKDFGADPIEKQIRQFLRAKFPSSLTAAFQALDVDQDQRLSAQDLREGLANLGMRIDENQMRSLMRRVDLDGDAYIEYDEFLLRFGIESAASGQWVYKIPEPPSANEKDAEAVRMFSRHMIGSKWWGRGGVMSTLKRFDQNRDGKLDRNEFKDALMDDMTGLAMSGLSDEDIAILLGGVEMDKPYCNASSQTVDISKFGQLFLDAYFEREKRLMKLLLVDNKWQDVKETLETRCIVQPSTQRRLVSKADVGLALQSLVNRGCIRSEDRDTLVDICHARGLFGRDGLYAGYLDYEKDLLQHFIATEMDIHALILPVWQQLAEQMMGLGGCLTYSQVEQLFLNFRLPGGLCLSRQQVSWLIDVLDRNCDGSVSYNEMVDRYARDEYHLALAMEFRWLPVWRMLHETAKKTLSEPGTLPPALMQLVLIKAIESKVLPGLEKSAISRLLNHVSSELFSDLGEIKCEQWVHKYVGQRFLIHRALEHTGTNGLPIWDQIIVELEASDRCCLDADDDSHTVSRERLRRILLKVGIDFAGSDMSDGLMGKLLHDLDPALSGILDWMELVEGKGAAAAYFFSARDVMKVRRTMRNNWRQALQLFVEAEVVRSSRPRVLNSSQQAELSEARGPSTSCEKVGLLTISELEQCLRHLIPVASGTAGQDENNVEAANKASKMTETVSQLLTDYARSGFRHHLADQEVMIDYIAMLRHYAQEEWSAQQELERKNEMVVTFLSSLHSSLASSMDEGRLPRAMLVSELMRVRRGLSQELVFMLLQGDSKSDAPFVDLNSLAWKAARDHILRILDRNWFFLYWSSCCSDVSGQGRLAASVFQGLVAGRHVGLSRAETEVLMRQIEVDAEGRIEYKAVLLGQGIKARGRYRNIALDSWIGLESNLAWECLASMVTDTSVGGAVSSGSCVLHAESGYHVAADVLISFLMQQRRRLGAQLESLSVQGLEKVVEVLDPNHSGWVSLDRAIWMLCSDNLRCVLAANNCDVSRKLLKGFREEAGRWWDKYAGDIGLEGYKRGAVDNLWKEQTWGLPREVTEQCVRKCLRDIGWINHLHIGALVRRSAKLSACSGSDFPRSATVHITQRGLSKMLRGMQRWKWDSEEDLIPEQDSWESENYASELWESEHERAQSLFATAMAAAGDRPELWLEYGSNNISEGAERKAAVWLQGLCGQQPRAPADLHGGLDVGPAPLQRTHLQQIMPSSFLQAASSESTLSNQEGGNDAGNAALQGDKAAPALNEAEKDLREYWAIGNGGRPGLEHIWMQRQSEVYSRPSWRLLCMERSGFLMSLHSSLAKERLGNDASFGSLRGASYAPVQVPLKDKSRTVYSRKSEAMPLGNMQGQTWSGLGAEGQTRLPRHATSASMGRIGALQGIGTRSHDAFSGEAPLPQESATTGVHQGGGMIPHSSSEHKAWGGKVDADARPWDGAVASGQVPLWVHDMGHTRFGSEGRGGMREGRTSAWGEGQDGEGAGMRRVGRSGGVGSGQDHTGESPVSVADMYRETVKQLQMLLT